MNSVGILSSVLMLSPCYVLDVQYGYHMDKDCGIRMCFSVILPGIRMHSSV